MEKITIKGKILEKVKKLREIKKLNKEHAIELDTEGRKLFIVKKTDEYKHPSGAKIERFILTPVDLKEVST